MREKWMWGILTLLSAIIVALILFPNCNKTIIDTTYKFDYAVVALPNGEVVQGKVETWKDYEGDQIQVKIDGKVYLVHSANIALIKN